MRNRWPVTRKRRSFCKHAVVPASLDPSEALTRATRIDSELRSAGWTTAGVDFEVEYQVGSKQDEDVGFLDYLLPDKDGRPLALVEAKRSSRDALAGKEQARLYADAIESRGGRRPLVFLANGLETWLWDHVSDPRRVSSFLNRDDLRRRQYQLENRVPLSSVEINASIVERDYQHAAIRAAHAAFEQGRRRVLWVMATGTGKTRAVTALIDTLMRASWAQRVLILTDRVALADQAAEALAEHLPNEPVGRITGSTYDTSRRLQVSTLQTMQDFHTSFGAGAFDLVITDECHRSIYNRWESVLARFDARLVGLTATPSDFLGRDTFTFFDCQDRRPTYGYELDEAVADGWLVPYEAYHARTTIQLDGIDGSSLSPQRRAELIEQGIDPDDIDFAGSELERKVTNEETTRLLVEEFFEQAITDPEGHLPGKSIIFAMSHGHARRIQEAFSRSYPQFPGLAEVIDSHVERPQEILRRFKREDLPRVAVTVDMLDTGVDVPTVVNLGLLKPVLSKIKFWQMLGRGTRRVDDEATGRSWCPSGSKDRYRALDFWGNFERFQLDPDGVAPAVTTPVAVRALRSLVALARAATRAGREDLVEAAHREIHAMVEALPTDSSGVRQEQAVVDHVITDRFWQRLDETGYRLLTTQVAPLMRYLGGVDLTGLAFDSRCQELAAALLDGDTDGADRAAVQIADDVSRLPVGHPAVSSHSLMVENRRDERTVAALSPDEVLAMAAALGPLMSLRLSDRQPILRLNLEDAFAEQRWLTVGPDAREYDVAAYRTLVEEALHLLLTTNATLIGLASGDPVGPEALAQLVQNLNQPPLHITEASLRSAYAAPYAGLVALLRHAVGAEALPDRRQVVSSAFEAFLSEKGYLDPDRRLLVRLVASRTAAQVEGFRREHLYEEPFLSGLGMSADLMLPPDDLDELLALAAAFGAT